jgi:hypothetical protein
MPNRIIKESVCTSENIDLLSTEAESFFYRLIVSCDDYGRMDARFSILRAKCYPLKVDKIKEKDIDKWLLELIKADLITYYVFNSRPYLEFKTWQDHQQVRANKSKFPGPNDEGSQPIEVDINCNQLQSNVPVTRNTLIDNRDTKTDTPTPNSQSKKQDKPKKEYAENVHMTEEEHGKLVTEFGADFTAKCIEKLNNSKGASGLTYKSDYFAIRKWVIKAVKEEEEQAQQVNKSSPANIVQIWDIVRRKLDPYKAPEWGDRLIERAVKQVGYGNLCQMDEYNAQKKFIAAYNAALKEG